MLKQLWQDIRQAIRRVPDKTVFGLIVFMFAVFLFGEVTGITFDEYNARPLDITNSFIKLTSGQPILKAGGPLITLVTAVFLHGSFGHVSSNAIYLWPFATLTSGLLGNRHVLWIFLATGVIGNVVQVMLSPHSDIPMLGASGAVMGFEGVYVGLASRWRLNWPHVWPLAHPISPMRLAIFALVGVVFDFLGVFGGLGGIAYGAHIGGFVSGFLIGVGWTFRRSGPKFHRTARW